MVSDREGRRNTSTVLGIALAIIVLAAGWLVWGPRTVTQTPDDAPIYSMEGGNERQGSNSSGRALSGGVPAELSHLVDYTDIVISGTIKAVGTYVWYEPPPTPGPTPTFDSYRPLGIHLGGYYTFYRVEVDEVIKGRGLVSSTNIITLASSYPHQINVGAVNDSFLYFLTKYLYDDLYGMGYGAYGRLLIDGEPVRYTDDHEGPVPFATELTVAEFLHEVDAEVDRQATATITPMPSDTPDPSDAEDPRNPTPTP